MLHNQRDSFNYKMINQNNESGNWKLEGKFNKNTNQIKYVNYIKVESKLNSVMTLHYYIYFSSATLLHPASRISSDK